MQEIKKRRIVLASVLKPVDEPRMFERMGQSLQAHGYDVFIIGSPPASSRSGKGIQFLSIGKIKRISLKRVLVRFDILNKILSIRPDILIVTTHELLGAAIIYRMLTGKKIIYYIQEDYWSNLIYTNAFPKPIKYLLAFFVRLKETVSSIFISKFLLAEKCYADEIKFISNKYSIIENKCKSPDDFQRKPGNNSIQLIFTGTLAESTGIFLAINLAKKLHGLNPQIKLKIIGYCQQPKTLDRIKKEIEDNSFISLIGGENFVSHREIMDAISTAHFGIVSYPLSPHIQNKVPTKLYEYLSCQLPILLQNNDSLKKICAPFNAAITIDFSNPDVRAIDKQIREATFYTSIPTETNWQSEEAKFVAAINQTVDED